MNAHRIRFAALAGATLLLGAPAVQAAHIPVSLDVDMLWSPLTGHVKSEGYLEFINPREFPGRDLLKRGEDLAGSHSHPKAVAPPDRALGRHAVEKQPSRFPTRPG